MHKNKAQDTTESEVPLEQRISYRLQRIGTLLTTQVVGILKSSGDLTLNQWRLLDFVKGRDGGSAHELAKRGYVDKATMSRASADLMKRGYIEVSPNPSDRRASRLYLTDKGRAALAATDPLMRARQQALLSAITPEEKETLFRVLDKLEAAVTEKDREIT
ncbi:Multidrug resistance operon repressor [Tritonibacter multivorans]|uniref:Multidrug resistance operon repressor n=1 Tax=Tritonibacter multivorans TaxID=928856 RepID=A0A0P1GIV5_9RHOB|nr:MarR family winged helix-turn-helix transcriptional regulator [Tritonibacter multivorans]MDA7422917.1 MarR family winged helix-turn-helix transcriptional regulator [Tritonibacter multivorans]CUH74684.1 Multidrug resistance operon repressor [Tritonibacter multivorans]SFD75904.1 DNA-binding transcriptional regulator, MarR family [Tritonibacter multivorans]